MTELSGGMDPTGAGTLHTPHIISHTVSVTACSKGDMKKGYQLVIRNNFIPLLAVFQISVFYYNNDFCNRLVSICHYPGLLTPRVSLVSSTSRSQHTLCWWQSVPHINYTNIDLQQNWNLVKRFTTIQSTWFTIQFVGFTLYCTISGVFLVYFVNLLHGYLDLKEEIAWVIFHCLCSRLLVW